MPVCKGEYGTYYRGDEPSPKGLGYCARSEGVGKRRKGNDGETWVVRKDRIGRCAWKRASSSSSSYQRYGSPCSSYQRRPCTPKRKTIGKYCHQVKHPKGIKIPFDMCIKLDGLKLKEYITRHLVDELRSIQYLDYTLSWCTGWEYLLVEPREKIHIFKRLIDVPKGQEGKAVLKVTGPECVQVMPRDPYQSIRTLITTAPSIFVDIFDLIIKEIRAGQQSIRNPNREEVITMTTKGFGEGHMFFNLTPIPNAPPHVDHRFGNNVIGDYVDPRFNIPVDDYVDPRFNVPAKSKVDIAREEAELGLQKAMQARLNTYDTNNNALALVERKSYYDDDQFDY